MSKRSEPARFWNPPGRMIPVSSKRARRFTKLEAAARDKAILQQSLANMVNVLKFFLGESQWLLRFEHNRFCITPNTQLTSGACQCGAKPEWIWNGEKSITQLRKEIFSPIDVEQDERLVWYCKTHKRAATYLSEGRSKPECDPMLSGILLPCDVELRKEIFDGELQSSDGDQGVVATDPNGNSERESDGNDPDHRSGVESTEGGLDEELGRAQEDQRSAGEEGNGEAREEVAEVARGSGTGRAAAPNRAERRRRKAEELKDAWKEKRQLKSTSQPQS